MQLRRFTADSTPAALGAVRLALGDDAIILANRRVGNQVEIIATGQMDDVDSMVESSEDTLSVALANSPAQSQQVHASEPMSAVQGQHMGAVVINADVSREERAEEETVPALMTAAALEKIRNGHEPVGSGAAVVDDTVSISDLSQSIDSVDIERVSLTGKRPSLVMHGGGKSADSNVRTFSSRLTDSI